MPDLYLMYSRIWGNFKKMLHFYKTRIWCIWRIWDFQNKTDPYLMYLRIWDIFKKSQIFIRPVLNVFGVFDVFRNLRYISKKVWFISLFVCVSCVSPDNGTVVGWSQRQITAAIVKAVLVRHSVRMSLGICPGASPKFWRPVGSI